MVSFKKLFWLYVKVVYDKTCLSVNPDFSVVKVKSVSLRKLASLYVQIQKLTKVETQTNMSLNKDMKLETLAYSKVVYVRRFLIDWPLLTDRFEHGSRIKPNFPNQWICDVDKCKN